MLRLLPNEISETKDSVNLIPKHENEVQPSLPLANITATQKRLTNKHAKDANHLSNECVVGHNSGDVIEYEADEFTVNCTDEDNAIAESADEVDDDNIDADFLPDIQDEVVDVSDPNGRNAKEGEATDDAHDVNDEDAEKEKEKNYVFVKDEDQDNAEIEEDDKTYAEADDGGRIED